MAVLIRLTDFVPNTLIQSAQVDAEFQQLVDILSGVSTTKEAVITLSHATTPPLTLDQLGAGPIQQWKQTGIEMARVNVDGSFLIAGLDITSATPTLTFTDTNAEDFRIQANGDALNIDALTGPVTFMTFRGGANDDIRMLRATRIDPTLKMNTDSATDALGVPNPVVNIVEGQAIFSFNANVTPTPDEPYFAVSNGTVQVFGGHASNADGAVFGAFSDHKVTLRANNVNSWHLYKAPWQVQPEATTDPTSSELTAGNHFSMYRKNDKFVIAVNIAGTINYLSIQLDGADTSWSWSTSAP